MLRRLFDLARLHRLILPLSILLGWLAGLAAIIQAWVLSGAIDSVFLGGKTISGILPLLLIAGFAILFRAVASGGSEYAASRLSLHIRTGLRRRLLDHLARLGPAYTRREGTGELVASAMEGVESLDAFFSQVLPQAALAAFIPLSILLLVFPLDPLTGLVFLLTAPLIPVFMVLIGRTAEALTRRQWDSLSRLSAVMLDLLQGLTTLKLFGQSRRREGLLRESSDRFRDLTLGVLRITFLSALVLELLSTLSTAIVAVEIGLRLLYGHIAFHQALFILVVAPDFYLPLRQLGMRFHAGMSALTAARRIFEILETPPPARLEIPPSSIVDPLPRMASGITFQGVSFTYPGRDRPALDDLSLEIPAGKLTALVGPSGAGKSTLASLLLRFIEPSSGRIGVDGIPLPDLPVETWRRSLAWVPQNPSVFNDTLAANLLLARPDAGRNALLEACRRAGLEDFIATLPLGLETPVGERGSELSRGQGQRLALARAFLRDAPFLVLDEPTSSLDPALEDHLSRVVQDLMVGRTVLVIAHRLNTVRLADRILVLDSGRLVESGTHARLLAQPGLYARLVRPAVEPSS